MVRLGFVQLDILADSCLKDNVPEIGADILENLVRESRPTVEESRYDASNGKIRVIEAPFDSIDRVHDLLDTFECEIGHCDRNIDLSSGKESIDCQES